MKIPSRNTLARQATESLRMQIRSGALSGKLPPERILCQSLQISRSTLRIALKSLKDAGEIEPHQGRGTRICEQARSMPAKSAEASIGVLLPMQIDRWRHFVTLVIDDIRTRLHQRNYTLELHPHPHAASNAPRSMLEKQVASQRHAAWVLIGCSHQTQAWFAERSIPAVVSGTSASELELPVVSLDNRALGRHAAATLLRHGHRRIGLVLSPGNEFLKTGLEDVFNRQTGSDFHLKKIEVNPEPGSIVRGMERLFSGDHAPTALFIAESDLYLSVVSLLGQRRLRVPEDVSLLCRDDEPYLQALHPSPARYSKSPHVYANRIDELIHKISQGERLRRVTVKIMPAFVAGDSLGHRGAL